MRVMTVDPGSLHTGVSVWENEKLVESLTISQPQKDPWQRRAEEMLYHVLEIPEASTSYALLIEMPRFMGITARGRDAAEHNSLTIVSFMAGFLSGGAAAKEIYESGGDNAFPLIALVEPASWKGTTDNAIIRKRLAHQFPEADSAQYDDEVCAIGIGAAFFGSCPDIPRIKPQHILPVRGTNEQWEALRT